jgi:hypothetical protein
MTQVRLLVGKQQLNVVFRVGKKLLEQLQQHPIKM